MRDIDFNRNWLFEDAARGRREEVILPHDAMIGTERNPDQSNYFLLAGFEGGEYVYTKHFMMDQAALALHHVLEFEAIYCMSEVFLNSEKIAEKAYGYTPLAICLDHKLREGENEIRVVCHVPKEGHNRWYSGGGISRPVHLYESGENYIEPGSVRVTTMAIHPALLRVEADIRGTGNVHVRILDQGRSVTEISVPSSVCEEDGHLSVELSIDDAKLWDADHPNLYDAEVSLMEGDTVYDMETASFGIRMVRVESGRGLFINDHHVFLRGGCIHNDLGVIGVVANDSTELHRAKILKATGFNAIRSAHHPMSRSLMKACDEVGLYVMDEAFDYWTRMKNTNPFCQLFADQYLSEVDLFVKDAYNHPSVIMYSIGNEIPEAGSVRGVTIGRNIVNEIHKFDQTRLTTLCPSVHWLREYLDGTPYLTEDEDRWIGNDPERKKQDWNHYVKIFMGAAANLPDEEKGMNYPPTYVQMDEDATKNLYPDLDVAGYNYYEDKYETLHSLHPERLLLGTETRGDRIVDTMAFAKKNPYLIGDFIWTLQDHLGEVNCCGQSYGQQAVSRAYPWIANACGLVDITGEMRPEIHRYPFAWGTSEKHLYISAQVPVHDGQLPHFTCYRVGDTVEGWTFEGCEGRKTWIRAYTDAALVKAFINGKEAGSAVPEKFIADIPCVYEPGEVLVIAYDEKGSELERASLKTADAEAKISVSTDKDTLEAGGEDYAFLSIDITDAHGVRKFAPEHQITIHVSGEGVLQGFGSADPVNDATYRETVQTTYQGHLQAVIRSDMKEGRIRIECSGEGLPDEVIELSVHSL